MFARVLVVIEQATARRIVGWVRRLLAPGGGELRLLVVLPEARMVTGGGRIVAFAHQMEEDARRAAELALAGIAARLRDDGLAASVEVRYGKVAAGVLAAARAWRADAIAVVDTRKPRGHGWLERGVTDELLALAPVPVLVARDRGQRFA